MFVVRVSCAGIITISEIQPIRGRNLSIGLSAFVDALSQSLPGDSLMFKFLRLLFLLALAALVPYLLSETDFGRSAYQKISALFGKKTQEEGQEHAGEWGMLTSNSVDATYANHSHYEVEKLRQQSVEKYRYDNHYARKLGGNAKQTPMPSLVGENIPDLRAVLRFDINPDWVIQRFARVSTVLGDMTMQGLRVPVVTGTQTDDLAGTLTYYFDRSGALQRLTVHGFTGDPKKLVGAMTNHYGLKPEPALEAGVFTKRWNGKPTHFLRLTHAPVVYSDAVHQKYTVFLELNHPNLAYGISNEARRIVSADHSTGRW